MYSTICISLFLRYYDNAAKKNEKTVLQIRRSPVSKRGHELVPPPSIALHPFWEISDNLRKSTQPLNIKHEG